MAIFFRPDNLNVGLCAAEHERDESCLYIDDGIHYEMSVIDKVLVTKDDGDTWEWDNVEAFQFNNETKDRAFKWVTCTHWADFEDGQPVMKITVDRFDETVRFGDWVVKSGVGSYKVYHAARG